MDALRRNGRDLARLLLVLWVLAAGTAPALAQSDEARRAYDRAEDLLEREDYRGAARAFQRVQEEWPEDDVAPRAAYWSAFALYREGDTASLERARRRLQGARRWAGTAASSWPGSKANWPAGATPRPPSGSAGVARRPATAMGRSAWPPSTPS